MHEKEQRNEVFGTILQSIPEKVTGDVSFELLEFELDPIFAFKCIKNICRINFNN